MKDGYIEFEGQIIRCYDKGEAFALAEEWLAENLEKLKERHPEQHLIIDAMSPRYMTAPNHNEGVRLWRKLYGPPPQNGWYWLCAQL